MAVTITSLILLLIGLALGAGGIWLASLGGSWYYIISGIAFLITAWLLYRRRSTALWLYAAIVLGTLAWAVWEIGFDWWELGPRGGIIVLVALWLLTPWARRGLVGPDGRAPLILAVLASLAVAGYSMTTDPKDIAGNLDTDKVTPAADLGGDIPAGEWHFYGRTPYGQRYSPLDQITPENVANLQPAWTYRTGDVKGPDDVGETTYQVTPLKIADTLYICTPHNFAIAIDAATGKEKWRYDPQVKLDKDRQHQTCRGVSYYADAKIGAGQPCAARVYLPTSDARLIALDAANGQVCPSFAEGGTLNLLTGMPYPKSGYYYSTSAPLISGGKIIVGGAVNDNYSTQEPSGVIRAFDASTGALIWNWDSGNPDQTTPLAAGQTYTANSPNMWSTPSADEKLGLLYIPLGNQTPDQLGAGRSANVEKFSSSITALDLNTGQLKWVRQTVHHDLWDMDVPAQPSLVDITKTDGTVVPALVGPTKQGDLYVLDRRTGEPVIPVKEVPAPGGAIEGDHTSPTQPVSDLSFNPQPLTDADMWGITMFDQLACRIALHRLRYEGRYTPPSLQGTLVYPGNFGVFNWGGVAVDPVRQVLFGMPTYLAFTSRLVPRADVPPPGDAKGSEQGLNRNDGAPYAVVMGPFLSPLGIPCQAPPWGYVAGADLRTGQIVYKHRNGTVYDMTPLPLPLKVGVPGIGGPMITAGGVAFLGAAVDDYLRAYDLTSGRQLWQARLPAGGQSTPMTYTVADGRQFVVIVAGGHGSVGTKPGDYVMAYALPK
ncbi:MULTISPECIES: glucose/quinate/shikimate family membrane-bound PQQ-dependent dehydrogenase [unclassified Mesorhizobium]|uniref:glucose/quinate/shikimate family membrane-bound PQQ-dependent dehydrogenase n=1 Tax=unclassified Mesorhizobium TaxID=325217 RepID=UPI001128200A|nr:MULTISPECIES: glucose/quinate/shikimate family membrane-bound PQQ-dependent dehydrogenase [unclassified Mesorhizobium]TPK67042.1 glucose/quinate/shikimate family membrane-bound PQQ-dependent dehydrogenase [Mesorhizobium sp. B2-5-1]TPM61639.1 glucose/quinate/shikimate family membrane-bound PQQ-dependent dehydrogenase [Mesorhizobium sp. B2-1-9]TPM86011.1 glucose/quinate/shikimate family membrane-bound PQQ-dependent dehydrogenase [Mesorhizobium sp. B2-1-4]TPN13493.1 glucose/quinate/shikimate fa